MTTLNNFVNCAFKQYILPNHLFLYLLEIYSIKIPLENGICSLVLLIVQWKATLLSLWKMFTMFPADVDKRPLSKLVFKSAYVSYEHFLACTLWQHFTKKKQKMVKETLLHNIGWSKTVAVIFNVYMSLFTPFSFMTLWFALKFHSFEPKRLWTGNISDVFRRLKTYV